MDSIPSALTILFRFHVGAMSYHGRFIIYLFSNTAHMYEVDNNGGRYNFGFVLGAGILFGGSGKSAQ